MKLKKVISLAIVAVMALAVPFTAMAANNEYTFNAEVGAWNRDDVWSVVPRTAVNERIYADQLTSDALRVTELTLNIRDMNVAIPEGGEDDWINITIETSIGQRLVLVQSILARNNTIDEFGFGFFPAMQGGVFNFGALAQIGGDRLFGGTAIQGLRQALVHPSAGTNDFDVTVWVDGDTLRATLTANGDITYEVYRPVANFDPDVPVFITSVTAARATETTPIEFNWGLEATTLAGTVISVGLEAPAQEVPATPAPTAPPTAPPIGGDAQVVPSGEVDKVQTPGTTVPITSDNITIATAIGLIGAMAVAGLFVLKKVRTN